MQTEFHEVEYTPHADTHTHTHTNTQLVVFYEITISLFTLLVSLPFCGSNKNTYTHTP